MLDKNKKGNSKNFFVLNAPKFPGISHFNSLQWLYGYPKHERDGCLLFQPFILISPNPKEEERKGIILKKVFVLLISRRSASSPMPPIRILY